MILIIHNDPFLVNLLRWPKKLRGVIKKRKIEFRVGFWFKYDPKFLEFERDVFTYLFENIIGVNIVKLFGFCILTQPGCSYFVKVNSKIQNDSSRKKKVKYRDY